MQIDANELGDAIREGTVVVVFMAQASDASEQLQALIDQLKSNYGEKIDFYSVDMDEYPECAAQYEITTIPTVGLFKDGNAKVKIEGVHSVEVYHEELSKIIG